MMLIPRKPRREMLTLQLTAMIDVFSILTIFLIKGTVFGVSDVSMPDTMKLPESVSKESVESAPQVLITKDSVQVSILAEPLPLTAFSKANDPAIVALKEQLKAYVKSLPPEAKSSGVLLNVISDRETPYRNVFDTVKVFREAGFETLLLVAVAPPTGEGQ
jgi:biopolymer transport protein ExbD